MPTYHQHVLFVNSKPYAKWYKILNKKDTIGTVYLSKINEIGIHLINNNHQGYYPAIYITTLYKGCIFIQANQLAR